MKPAYQKTLKTAIQCSGVGLHSGLKVSMTLQPAAPDSGIVFRRVDVPGEPVDIAAHWRNAVETPLCTTLVGANGLKVSTIEHLMSALAGCGIDNAIIEIDGEEVPIMDGSSAPFVFLIECAGIEEQDVPARAIRILKDIVVEEPHRSARLVPHDAFQLDFEIEFDNPAIARQSWAVDLASDSYKSEVAPARTFGFLHEVEKLRAMGLARGGSLSNAIVISDGKVLNDEGLRFENEFVRHKTLDSIGDLYLAGARIEGRFEGHCAGHALTLRLLRALFADESAWCWSDASEPVVQVPEKQHGPTVAPARAVARWA